MEELFNIMANAWDGGLSDMQESTPSNNMMEDSIAKAYDFFLQDESIESIISPNDFSFDLDSLYTHSNLSSMGIVGQDGLDLMMAHEGTNQILQGMDLGFSAYQKELCSDYMAGVRAGISGIDISQMADFMTAHQFGDSILPNPFRLEALNEGMAFAQDYMESHHAAPDFSNSLKEFLVSESFDNGDVVLLANERELWDDTVQHYEDKLTEDASLEENIDEYRDAIEHCFAARAEYDLLSDKIAIHLTERLDKGETTSSVSHHVGKNISFLSRESMRSYDDYSIYDSERPKMNPFGVYAMSHHHDNYPPTDHIEKPELPNDFTHQQLQNACDTICKAAGIKSLPVFISTETPNAEFQTMRGPFRFTLFDDRIVVNPDYVKNSIEHFGNTDSLLLDLAHEIGHELNSLCCGKLSRYMDEKLADMFSGMIADKMGIDIDVARQWDLWLYDGLGEEGYPPSEERWDIKAAGNYYSHFATIEDYKDSLRDMHFLERVRDYSTDPVTTLAQQELDYQLNRPQGIKEDLKDILDGVKKYLTIERI